MAGGSEFHNFEAKTLKDRPPKEGRLKDWMARAPDLADRCLLLLGRETTQGESLMKGKQVPSRADNENIELRPRIGSQSRFRRIG